MKDEQIAELEARIDDKFNQMEELEQQIAMKDAIIKDLENDLAMLLNKKVPTRPKF